MEVRLLNNTDPTLVLLVHYCVAYPRSGNAVWILLYNGYSFSFDLFFCNNKKSKKSNWENKKFLIRLSDFNVPT